MENMSQPPSRIKVTTHLVGWMIFFFAPVILSPVRDIGTYFSEPGVISSLVVRNILLISLFYVNLFYLTPKFFTAKRPLTFFVSIGILIFIVGAANFYIHEVLAGPLEGAPNRPPDGPPDGFGPGPREGAGPGPGPHHRRLMLASPFFSSLLLSALVATASTLSVMWNNWVQARAEEQERTLQKVAAELSVLKLQISPHFLFNTLNNIRWLVRSNSAYAEPALVKLSQLLRYVLYQSGQDQVPLEKEVAHLQDYISLQKMRLPENRSLDFAVKGELHNKRIVPLLIIPIVENFFKHGDFGNCAESLIELTVDNHKLTFRTVNKISQKSPEGEFGGESGIGMENVKRRLELHYPKNHVLKRYAADNSYFVYLEINLF